MRTPSAPLILILALVAWGADPLAQTAPAGAGKLGPIASRRAAVPIGWSRVIVRAANAEALSQIGPLIQQAGGVPGVALDIINGRSAYLPDVALAGLANSPFVAAVSLDRLALSVAERTSATVGASAVREQLGYDGTGIGVAIIDSGVTSWHDDLSGPAGGQRVSRFVDFVNTHEAPYDDNGHGTHVSGIVAGNGFDSAGARAGIAPGASLIALKALDANGTGRISSVIAALDWILKHRTTYNIRVVNLSLAAGVYESYDTDPLTVAAKQVVDAGVVVVAAAGNAGRALDGRVQYGGVLAPGNAPWVLTVGASSHGGTASRVDDSMAAFSSRGPTAFNHTAKPDLVAPGVGIESLSDPSSKFYTTKSPYLLNGSGSTSYMPYLSLTGTSMAAPVVTGTVALMLQANGSLTPNAVKAILQYSAEVYPGYDRLTQGAGFLNAGGAVALARSFADPAAPLPDTSRWSGQIIWGNHLVRGGVLVANANAWSRKMVWGAASAPSGQPAEWGVICSDSSCATRLPWRVICSDATCGSMLSAYGYSRNIVWGRACGGVDCSSRWTLEIGRLARATDETVVWGSSENETVVWGSSESETVVWGSSEDETVVWGSSESETVVWGSNCGHSCEPVIW